MPYTVECEILRIGTQQEDKLIPYTIEHELRLAFNKKDMFKTVCNH